MGSRTRFNQNKIIPGVYINFVSMPRSRYKGIQSPSPPIQPIPPEIEEGDDEVQTLVTRKKSVLVPAGRFVELTIPVGYRRYELKTVRATNTTNDSDIVVSFYDSFEDMQVYESNPQSSIYDIANIPVEDQNSNNPLVGNIYMIIKNTGNQDISVDYEIKLLNLR